MKDKKFITELIRVLKNNPLVFTYQIKGNIRIAKSPLFTVSVTKLNCKPLIDTLYQCEVMSEELELECSTSINYSHEGSELELLYKQIELSFNEKTKQVMEDITNKFKEI